MAFEYTNIPSVLRRSDSDPIVSASNNDVEGIGFFASTSARDSLSNRLRQSNFLAIIGTTVYVYTGSTFTPSGVDDFIADLDWQDASNWASVSGSSTITISDVTNLQTELNNLATDISANVTQVEFDAHSHVFGISDITGLVAELAAKASTVHGHVIGDVANLATELAGKADSNHNHDSDYAAISHTHDADDVTHTRGATNWDVGLWIDSLFTANATQDTAISANNVRSLSNQSAIATNVTDIATNASDIADNVTTLGTKANSADLEAVATSGNYNDLNNTPTPFELKFTSDFTITDPVGNLSDNHAVLTGENIEDYLVEMVTSYQNPVASISTYGGFTSAFFTMIHGTTFSASSVAYSLSHIGNVNTGDTGSLAFTDSHTSNQTRTFTPAASGTVSFSPAISSTAKVTTSTGGTGTARSRSNAFKMVMSGMTNSEGVAINTLTRKGTIVYRSRICKSSTNFFGGITNLQGETLFASAVSTQNSSDPFSSYTNTTGVSATDYLYFMVPESIHTFNGGTTTGVGTMQIGFQGAVTSTTVPVWCGTATFAPVGSATVKYHVLRVGGVGAYSDSTKVKFA